MKSRPLIFCDSGVLMTKPNRWKLALATVMLCLATTVAAPSQTFTVLATFTGSNGELPPGPLTQGTDGNLYGTTNFGGTNMTECFGSGCGTVFMITPVGTLTTLHNFDGSEGCEAPGLTLGTDGNFYGVVLGCTAGEFFRMTTAGQLTTLYSFCHRQKCLDGEQPDGLPVQATDGNFYGTTLYGGTYNSGTAYRMTVNGKLTTIYNFCPPGRCKDGNYPMGLMQATNGELYGTDLGNAYYYTGTIFRMSLGGQLTILDDLGVGKNADESSAFGLIQGTSGDLYGAFAGGPYNSSCPSGCGGVFKMSLDGDLTILYTFCSQANCADGDSPGSLVQGNDGNFYGTAAGGGDLNCNPPYNFGCGTLFQLTPQGVLTVLHTFEQSEGDGPGGLVQATDGNFYGTAELGGDITCQFDVVPGCGTVFKLSTGLAPFVEPNPHFGVVGHVVDILGNNLTGTASVTFNGTAAKFKVISTTYIKAEVPTGATTGTIQVITPSGTLNSNVAFQVLQ
jgi:uncharacterized repeat protein (TIGR03803 family)